MKGEDDDDGVAIIVCSAEDCTSLGGRLQPQCCIPAWQ